MGENAGLSITRYLRPEEQVVPFWARPELNELLGWCTSGGHARIRLVTGNGGAGKSRLALQLGEELLVNGWQQLWVKRGSEHEVVADARVLRRRCVLVVDYAETRGELAGLLDDVAADRDGPELRVVLLARSAGEWWQQVLASAEEPTAALLQASAPIRLGPIHAAGGVQEVFDHAVTAFAQKVGVDRPDARLALSDPDPDVLVVHVAALLAVANYATGAAPRQQAISGSDVLDALLEHEARYWAQTAASRGLDVDLSVLRRAVTAGCLIGAGSETAAGALLARITDLDQAERRGRVARWLHDLYPADEVDMQQGDWVAPLRPDRLAEQLIASELTRHQELIAPLFTGLDEARATRALTVLARAALTQDRAVGLLATALVADFAHLAIPALSVAIETNPALGNLIRGALTSSTPSTEVLERIADALPHVSFALGETAVLVLSRLAQEPASDAGQHAERLGELGNWLGDLGRPQEALAATDEAVTIYRRLAKDRPDIFLQSLAAALNNQSNRLSGLGREEEALAVIEEAVTIYRQLARDQPDANLTYLATSLDTKSGCLFKLGRVEEALTAIEEAVTIYQRLAESELGVALPNFAAALNNQSNYLSGLGRGEEALAAIERAVTLYRLGAEKSPDAILPNFAANLRSQSSRLSALGRKEEALTAIEEAVTLYRQLAKDRPDTMLPNFAAALNNQSARLSALGRKEGALAVIDEAVTICRQLAKDRPEKFLPDLASSLHTRADYLSGLGREEEALAGIEAAVTIYRELTRDRPDEFLSALAPSLGNQAGCFAGLGRKDEALAAIEEAVTIYRQLAQERPDEVLPDLAKSLKNRADYLSGLGREDEALAAIEEAVTIYRQLAQERPDEVLPDLAKSLKNRADYLSGLGREDEALAAIEEAITIYQQLAQTRPEVVTDLATSLFKQAHCLSELGREEEALAALLAGTDKALIAFRREAEDHPDQFLPNIVMSLNNLADLLDATGRESEAAAARAEALELSSRT